MNKSDLIASLAKERAYLPYKDCKLIVSVVFDEMSKQLIQKKRIELRGFGSLFTRVKPPRKARNPSTGESLNVGQKISIHFRPGKALREKIDYKNK